MVSTGGIKDVAMEAEVLVVGGGPVGMFAAYMLARSGQSCTLIEQSLETTKHPKMEYTSHRTMEIYRLVGLIDSLKAKAIPEEYSFREIFSTGYGEKGSLLASWERPPPAELRKKWAESNDGSHPLEPHMRQSQIVFEALLKTICQRETLIDDFWGYTFKSLVEKDDAVFCTVIEPSGKEIVIKTKYVIGCDGAGSKVRQSTGIGAPELAPQMNMLSVHFRSKDLTRMQSQGQFWHCLFMNGGALISQDEIETWTVHVFAAPGAEVSGADIEPLDFIYGILGGFVGQYKVKVDEVLVRNSWKWRVAIADSFRSAHGRVFLAGDAAHQLSPAGGHGLNSGMQDVYDLIWKLTAVLNGYAGDQLLESYSHERRSIAQLNVKMVEKVTEEILLPIMVFPFKKADGFKLIAQDEEGEQLRAELKETIDRGHWIHDQNGITLGYRYRGSPVIMPDTTSTEPRESITEYIPSTWPGARAPHVFLSDGKTSIFEKYGSGFTVIDFTKQGEASSVFSSVAERLRIPLTRVHLPSELHCREIWERDVVLIRPDGFVGWRSPQESLTIDEDTVEAIMGVMVGKELPPRRGLD